MSIPIISVAVFALVGWYPTQAVASDRVAVGLPVEASAIQDIVALKGCADDHVGDGLRCVGLVAKPCIDRSVESQTALTAMDCYEREAVAWDHLVDARLDELLKEATKQDAALGSYTERNSVETLKEAQRSWQTFRDAELARFWAMRAPAASHWRAADLEKLRVRLTASRYLDLLTM